MAWSTFVRAPEPALSEAEGFAPVLCIFRLVTPVLRALTWDSSYSEETAIDRLAPSGPHSSCTLRFPFREPSRGPIHFPLDLIPSYRYNKTAQVIYKITAVFDNLTRAQLLAIAHLLSPANQTKAKTFVRRFAIVQGVVATCPTAALTPMFRIFCL